MNARILLRSTVGVLLVIVAIAPGYAQRPQPAPPPAAGAPSASTSTAIVPFTIHVPDAVLTDLRERLTRARLPEELDGSGWTYGTNEAYLKDLVEYWRRDFDWRAQERRLNQFEQFKTNIDGIAIHFIHRRSKEPNALPLILVHGWPGSFAEFAKVIGPLTDPVRHGGRREDAFDVVIPSIPGYGFSDKPRERGYGRDRTAELFVKLMARLGYRHYGAQGGDLGAGIATKMALDDPSHVVGLHLNLCSGEPPDPANPLAGLPAEELARVQERRAFWTDDEQGYSHIQGTKPQTIGAALDDSPVGLAAWIVEKFRTWCDCDGNPEKAFTKDELLTNVTIYWATQTAASAARFYYENRHAFGGRPAALSPEWWRNTRVEVPTACAAFPKEISFTPRRWLERRYNITRFSIMPRGGHFAALEQPGLLVDDVRAFFRDLKSARR